MSRSKSDCPRVNRKIRPSISHEVHTKLEKTMHFVRQCALGKATKRMKRKADPKVVDEPTSAAREESNPLQAQAAALVSKPKVVAPADDSDDDIFADVGKDYVCEVKEKDKGAKAGSEVKYFGAKPKEEDKEAPPEVVREEVSAEVKETMRLHSEKEKKAREAKLMRMLNTPDEYQECYAGYHSQVQTISAVHVLSCVEQVDVKLLLQENDDTKGKKGKKKMKGKQEEDPDDVNVGQRIEQKFNNDYNKIAGIMKTKYNEDINAQEPKRQRFL